MSDQKSSSRKEQPRLDQRLADDGLAPSREKARGCILAGQVLVDGQKVDKPGTRVAPSAKVELLGTAARYASRGGLKLLSAWEVFRFVSSGRVCMDVGASTGGFTDFLLEQGARRVFAVDVGYGQLAWRLRQDPRVVVLERVNARQLTAEEIPEPIELAVVDVSFISLAKVLPALAPLLAPRGEAICLVKPQFEAGPGRVGKKGVVRDPAVHQEVLESCIREAPAWGLFSKAATHSAHPGPEGNIEFFLRFSREGPSCPIDAAAVVAAAHAALD